MLNPYVRGPNRRRAKKVYDLRRETSSLQTKKQDITKALTIEQQALETKLESTLRKLKHEKPELFEISEREQIAMLKARADTTRTRFSIARTVFTF